MLGGRNPLLAGVCAVLPGGGDLVSYAKARAEGLGLRCDVGLIERPERMLISLVAVGVSGLGVPYILTVGLWALAAAAPLLSGSGCTRYIRQRRVPEIRVALPAGIRMAEEGYAAWRVA